jgi:hypothetical protein
LPATYVTQAELRTLLGIGTLYSDSVVEEVAQAAENIVKSFLWFNKAYVYSTELKSLTATIVTVQPHGFVTGQSVAITESGAVFNGTYTITATTPLSFQYTKASGADQNLHLVKPYGVITGSFHGTDYATVPEIRQGAAMIAVDIWQSRQQTASGGISPDFQPSPYKMGNTLIARIRGLIANHLSPNGLVG